MNKPDIAKLVAAALEAEFGSYRNAELQHITAGNDGQYGESLPLCLLLTKKGESHKKFEAERLNWWRDLFNRRVTLAEAAGMLLGFSESMTRHSVFMTMDLNEKIAGTNKSKLELPLPLQTRPISSGLVTAFTDMRGDVKDWRATETYRPADLIAWAKEKDFVANEVLEAWEAHNQSEAEQVTVTATSDAVEAVQVTAPATPDAVQPEPHTPRVERHTTKGKRRDILTPVIEHAQSLCTDPWDVAEVWGKFDTLTAQKYSVLSHWEGKAVSYRDGDGDKKLTKKNLGDRLREARKKLV